VAGYKRAFGTVPIDWLAELFTLATLDPAQRASLLSGKPPTGEADRGRTVCACFNVGRDTPVEAIRQQGLNSVEAIGRISRRGPTVAPVCRSCGPC